MPTRTRTRQFLEYNGNAGSNSVPRVCVTGPLIDCGFETITDVVDQGDCQNLTITRYHASGGRLDRPRGTASTGTWYCKYRCQHFATNAGSNNYQHGTLPVVPSSAILAAKAAARTNPSRPYVDLPVGIGELGDLPRLIMIRGRTLISHAAQHNLAYHFGIAPLAGDIAKLLDWAKAFKFRKEELDRLYSERGLRRTVELGTFTNPEVRYQATVHSVNGATHRPWITKNTSVTIKGHCRWKPSTPLPKGTAVPDQFVTRLEDSMLGMGDRNISYTRASQLWELIPFSWLADWCGSVGDYLMANRNLLQADLKVLNLMTHTKSVWKGEASWDRTSAFDSYCSPFIVTRETMTRTSPLLTPSAHLPVLTGKQAGILASLLTPRGR